MSEELIKCDASMCDLTPVRPGKTQCTGFCEIYNAAELWGSSMSLDEVLTTAREGYSAGTYGKAEA